MPEHRPLEMRGWDISQPQALRQFLASLPTPPRLLALGEPTHGVQAFPRWRNRIFQVLVQEHAFRSIALESDVLAGLKVNDYALGGPGTLDNVMSTGLSHGFGAYAANRELVAWLREYNAGRPEAEQVRFYGFDAPMESMWAASPRACLLALHTFLAAHLGELPADAARIEELCGDDARWTNEAAAMNPEKSVGNTAEAKALRLLADDLNTLLEQEAPRLHAQPGFWLAQLHARTALGLLRYHAVIAQVAPDRIARMLAQRGLMMADNLSAVLEREQGRGPTLVFAHNLHLQRGVSGMNLASLSQRAEWWGGGAHLHTRLGGQYAFIASTLGIGEGIPEPAPDTLEGFLSGQMSTPTLYATRHHPFPDTLRRRTDTDYRVQALRPETLHEADGLLFLPTTEENA
ncbi:erythromycin esterase [Deinococcus piscis]|uniref:Erythromycin esterase n=1 Tax=Deinococcus piscis TaxID=394230 RepID=A0ABQ3K3Z4_9DEIO|nr:erythromycin esterase family protein [Deinococcus piscis]GHG02864.1 erythromycin esterase [Deinococcus piscis]